MKEFKNKKWKTYPCLAGDKCWCRLIVTEDFDGDLYKDDEIVIGSGQFNNEEAEYFVELHNERLEANG